MVERPQTVTVESTDIEGNIVITTNRVNAMKNDMSTEEFKKLISDIYKNISNF